VVDYSHTVIAHLDALTPGASTVGVSGFDYATAVPEPSMPALVGFGLGVLAVWERRHRRSAMAT
jgi:hypothetical protein